MKDLPILSTTPLLFSDEFFSFTHAYSFERSWGKDKKLIGRVGSLRYWLPFLSKAILPYYPCRLRPLPAYESTI